MSSGRKARGSPIIAKPRAAKVADASHHESDTSEPDHLGLERLIFFSDAVFAIAITLLALDIRLPQGTEAFSDAELRAALLGIWHKYLAYGISFFVIGTLWIGHHRKFRFIQRYDSRLLMLNLLMLMAIAFVPFPSSVLSEYSGRTATIFYALTMALAALLGAAIWWYAARHNRLIDPQLAVKVRRRQLISPLATAAAFLISIGIAHLNADVAKLSWAVIAFVSLYLIRDA